MTEVIGETDVLVVGGGPAGLAAAIAARAKGFRVVVADCSRPPIDKPCGEGLMPDALAALSQLGIAVRSEDSFPFRGIRFVDSSRLSSRELSRRLRVGGASHCAAPIDD